MKLFQMKSLGAAVLLGLAVVAASPSIAAGPNLDTAQSIQAMDTNRDGRLTKDEYLAAMSAIFDKHAGAKGYCTPDEVREAQEEIRGFHW